jgi:hypothetical protein
MEPTTARQGVARGRWFSSHATERLRVLGEIPLRKFPGGRQPLDPDGNPDTSFLARIPADTVFTFQTLDRQGLLLNMAQTWHQLRPGEIRHDCGGCHAHSQAPTDFRRTVAARPDYPLWDLTRVTPLLTDKAHDKSGRQWDAANRSGLRLSDAGVLDVEYLRDVQPILRRSCVACHTARGGREPAARLDLDADHDLVAHGDEGRFPGTYYRLALDEEARFGPRPLDWPSWGYLNASRYIRKFQARRSLLVWKLFGERLDGFSNDDHPSEASPGEPRLLHHGQAVDLAKHHHSFDLDYTGSPMPPPEAVAAGQVAPLTDEDRRTILRWIDLGCPIDLDFDPKRPERRGRGWTLDENRPVVTLTVPPPASGSPADRVLIGLYDYYSGLDLETLTVTANFPVDGTSAGHNLAAKLRRAAPGVWELPLVRPPPAGGRLVVTVKDRQGNLARLERTLSALLRPGSRS